MSGAGPAPDAGRRVVLPAVPPLGRLYARGAATSARRVALTRLGRPVGTLPEVEHVVRDVVAAAGRLTAYQHHVGEPASDALPAGFVHVLTFGVATSVLARPDFPLPLVGMVHLANRVEQARALQLGERLEVRAHAEGLRGHRSGTQVDVVAEVRVPGSDDVVWRGVSTLLARGVRPAGAAAGDDRDERDRGGGSRDGGSQHDGSRDGDGAAGAAPRRFTPPTPTARWVLPAGTGRRYAAVSGDRNPIHLSAATARMFGFPRAVAHGMDTAARALAAVGPARGEAFTWTVRFARPVLLPATVAVRVAPRDDGPGFGYAAWSPRSGTLHLTGAVVPAGR